MIFKVYEYTKEQEVVNDDSTQEVVNVKEISNTNTSILETIFEETEPDENPRDKNAYNNYINGNHYNHTSYSYTQYMDDSSDELCKEILRNPYI